MAEKYLIGDKIRFTASIVKLGSNEPDIPDVVTVTVYQKDGTKLLDKKNANKTDIEGEYFYDWIIDSNLAKDSRLVVVWDWSGSQKKKMEFLVEPEV